MGVFDSFKKGDDIQITPKEALALSALSLIGVDGAIDDEELHAVSRLIQDDQETINKVSEVYKAANNYETIVKNVSNVLSEDQKLATLINLIDIAMADGILAGAVEDLLSVFVSEFDLPEDKVSAAVNIISIKNDISIFTG